jgi:hypothetical protein
MGPAIGYGCQVAGSVLPSGFERPRVRLVALPDAHCSGGLRSRRVLLPARAPSPVIVMALKAGRRPDLGERVAVGDVRPVSNRLLVWLTVGVVVLVAVAITALIIASGSPAKHNSPTKNVPSAVSPSAKQTGPASSITP